MPNALSFLTYRRWKAEVKGLNAFPQDQWPTNIALLYYSYHIMVGLGTLFIAIMVVAAFLLWRGKFFSSRWMLWILLLSPAVSVHRQHRRLDDGGNRPPALAGLLADANCGRIFEDGFCGQWHVYPAGIHGHVQVLGIFFLFLVRREIEQGPKRAGLAALRASAVARLPSSCTWRRPSDLVEQAEGVE